MAVLGLLPTFKKDVRLAFDAHFLDTFSIKKIFDTTSIDQCSIPDLLFFLWYQTICVFKFLFSQFMSSRFLTWEKE